MAKVFHFSQSGKFLPTFFASLALWCINVPALAQENIPVQGKVTDRRTGEPLINANILIKGLNKGTVSNIDGEFSLDIPSLPATLLIGYIGYRPEEIDIYEKPSEAITVSLAENVLDEVVVVGYGTQKRSELTGSVASISKAGLEAPAVSFDNLLSGAVAGVQVTQSSGQPGATASIRIRGGNSITGGNEPLYVIDGQIMYNNNAATNTGIPNNSNANLNALATINPADIASIEVLKDASATAIYGSRGANGVILVTTRKGAGKDKIQYTGSFGQSWVTKKLDLLNAREFAELRNDILASEEGLSATNTPFTQSEINAFADNSADWQDAVFRTAWTQNHQLSLSGGDLTKYLISGNYLNQEGIVKSTGFERYALRANLQRTFSERLKTGLIFSTSSSTQTGYTNNGTTNVLVDILRTAPVIPIYEEGGGYHYDDEYKSHINSIADLLETRSETKVNRTFGNFFAEYKILPSLTARVTSGADVINAKQNYYAPNTSSAGLTTKGQAFVGNVLTKSWQVDLTLTYDRYFGENHHLTALAGHTVEEAYTESVLAGATGFSNDLAGFNDLGSGTAAQPSSAAFPNAIDSWLGRADYAFKNQYNITATFRADGSSRFASSHKWGYFPSIGLSWNANREDFLKDIRKIDDLKLRLSAGSIGNQEIGNFRFLPIYSSVLYGLGGQLVTGYAPENIANAGLKWEKTAQYNAGIDLSLLNSRINVVFDVYYKLTSDLLVDVPVPTSSGFGEALINVGNVSNRGVELSINADVVRGKRPKSFAWQTAFVIAHNKNRVESLGDDVESYMPRVPNTDIGRFNPLIVKEGYPLGTFWGYRSDGIVQQGEETSVPVPSWTRGDVRPGDRKFVDAGGDPDIINDDDRVVLGDAQPKFTFGFNNTFSYSGFDLAVQIQGSYGNRLYNALRSTLEIPGLAVNVSGVYRDRWKPANPSGEAPRAQSLPNAVVGDWLIEDASYIRLRNITLGYSLPKAWMPKAVGKARLFATGQNLLLLTKYTGYDPEVNTYEQESLYQGIDIGAYPSSKSWLAGIEITF